MNIIKAGPEHNDQLCHFFNQSLLPGQVDLSVQRKDFFSPYRMQSDDHVTYILMNSQNQIEATASLVFRDGLLGNSNQTIGYATDLRVSSSRRAIMTWAEHFMPILEEEKKKRNCQSVFTVVAQMQKKAYNAFIRPRLTRRNLPRYHLFRSFRLISVHGILPFAPKPLETLFVRNGADSDADMVAQYVCNRMQRSVLRYSTTPEQLIESWSRWPAFSIHNFVLAFDYQRRLVGCVAPWDNHHIHEVIPVAYHKRAKVLQESLSALSHIRLCNKMSNAGVPLSFQYLTHFYADNPDIFHALLYNSFQQCPRQFVIYPHFDGQLSFTPPRSMITASLKAGLYLIQDPSELSPEFLNWSRKADPPPLELPYI